MHGALVPSLGPQIYASAAPVSQRRQSSGEAPVWPTGDAVLQAADADTHGVGKRRSGAHLVRIRPGVAAPTGLMTNRVAHSGPVRLSSARTEASQTRSSSSPKRVGLIFVRTEVNREASRPSSPGRRTFRASGGESSTREVSPHKPFALRASESSQSTWARSPRARLADPRRSHQHGEWSSDGGGGRLSVRRHQQQGRPSPATTMRR